MKAFIDAGSRMASRRGKYRPLEQRLQIYNEVLQLREQRLSYSRIIEGIHKTHRVRLHRRQIYSWVHGVNTPLGNVIKFDAKPTPALAYIIGVRFGDGWLCKHGRAYMLGLNVKDYDFAVETGQNLTKLLGRGKPYRPRWSKWMGLWRVISYSVMLYQFLNRPWHNLRQSIEHCELCVAAFLRAAFDSEGSVNGNDLTFYNTDKELLFYIQQLLWKCFRIETTGPHSSIKAGRRFRDPRNGKIYKTKSTVYYLRVRVLSLPLFHRYIGFTIKRKQRRLTEAIQ